MVFSTGCSDDLCLANYALTVLSSFKIASGPRTLRSSLLIMHFLVFFICFIMHSEHFLLSHASPLTSQDLANCVSSHATIDPTCWSILELSAYVQDWNTTTPTCQPNGDTSVCCSPGEAWTTCFLRMNQPESGTDCTQIDSCAFSPSLAQLPAGNASAKAHYVI